MQMLGAPSLRDVIAFPKTKDARCPLTGAPGPVDPAQLDALGLAGLLREGVGVPAKARRSQARVDVDAAANLARLRVAPEEREALERQMAELVAFAGQLAEADTEGSRRRPCGAAGKRLPAGQGRNAPAARGPARGRAPRPGTDASSSRRSWNEEGMK